MKVLVDEVQTLDVMICSWQEPICVCVVVHGISMIKLEFILKLTFHDLHPPTCLLFRGLLGPKIGFKLLTRVFFMFTFGVGSY